MTFEASIHVTIFNTAVKFINCKVQNAIVAMLTHWRKGDWGQKLGVS